MAVKTVNREYHKWYSERLGRDMELLVFGHSGARLIVFPTSCGRFFDWENRRMMDPIARHIDNGWLQIFCVDSVDTESWFNNGISPHDRTQRHLDYQDYV
ncbi:MAG: esterase, partial [Terriglobales bacterium]